MVRTAAAPMPYPPLTSRGISLDTSGGRLRPLRDSTDALIDADELRRRMDADGYLFSPGSSTGARCWLPAWRS